MSDSKIEPPFTPNQFATDLEYWKEAEKFQRKRAEAAEARIKASQEQRPSVVIVGVSKLAIEIADANGNDIDWAVLGVGTKFYSSPVIPPDVAELQQENAELRQQNTLLSGVFPREAELTKLLSEAKSNSVPEGWQLVPSVPTYQQCAQAIVACPVFGLSINSIQKMYEAMLIAAPQPETETEVQMNKDEVLKLVGITGDFRGWTFDTSDQMIAFANACEKIGMEKAAKILMDETKWHWHPRKFAEAVRKEME